MSRPTPPPQLPEPFLPPPAPVLADDGTRRYEGVTYARSPGYRPRLLDAYVPPADGPVPAVVWIHGGGWMEGDRRYPPPTVPPELLFGSLTAAGLALVTVDYRHSLEAPFPAQLHDVNAAIRYVRRFAETLGIDPARVGMWGESAGGHLAALAALTATRVTASGDLEGREGVRDGDTSVRAVVDWYGVAEIASAAAAFPEFLAETAPAHPYTALLGAPPAERPDLAESASTITYVHQSAPPFLLIHGTDDTVVPCVQSEVLAERLIACGAEAELVLVPGADHIFLGAADVKGIVARSVAFLARHLSADAAGHGD